MKPPTRTFPVSQGKRDLALDIHGVVADCGAMRWTANGNISITIKDDPRETIHLELVGEACRVDSYDPVARCTTAAELRRQAAVLSRLADIYTLVEKYRADRADRIGLETDEQA